MVLFFIGSHVLPDLHKRFVIKDKATMTELIARDKYQTPVSREAVAVDWRTRGFSCELFIDPPGREWNNFVHRTDELVTVVEGRLEITIGELCITAQPGDEVFIPNGAVHSVKNIHSATTRWLYGYG